MHAFELRLDTRDVEERDPLSAAVDARAASGSYVELDRALAALRARDRLWHARLLQAVDAGEVSPLDPVLEPTLGWLVGRMPLRVRVPAEVRANWVELAAWRRRVKGRRVSGDAGAARLRRDAEIRRLLRRGSPAQWVAREFGLSVRQVYSIRAGGREGAAAG